MNWDSCEYDQFVNRLLQNGGALRLGLEEALSWWIAALQREVAGANPAYETREMGRTPNLMVRGMDGDDELFTEVVVTEDNPENLFDGTWWPIELWNS